jgi:osmotically-inducible protein OsmY
MRRSLLAPLIAFALGLALLFVLALTLSGCRTQPKESDVVGDRGLLEPEPTAMNQSMASRDVALVGEVRRRLVLDRDLSFAAKNVVVVVRDGVVTLRGRVHDAREHDALIQRVASVPDVVRLDDRLTWS